MVRFWDNIMRKKGLFLALMVVFIVTGLASYHLFFDLANSQRTSTQHDINIPPQPPNGYVNSLILRIDDAYELSFNQDFTQADVKVTSQLLDYPASVRIFDDKGRLIVGEYTMMIEPEIPDDADSASTPDIADNTDIDNLTDVVADEADTTTDDVTVAPPPVQYQLATMPKSYTLDLAIGYTIEISSVETTVISSLSGKVATNYQPTSTTETYVVMLSGLRKATWDVARGNAEMYQLVREYFAGALREYAATISDDVLHNKNLDVANKAQALVAFYQLKAEDQVEFQDFIDQIRRGGWPQIVYHGQTEYYVGEQIDLGDLITVSDAEDGVIEKIVIQTDLDFSRPGEYLVTILATDSDKNSSSLNFTVIITDPYAKQPDAPADQPGSEDQNSTGDNSADSNQPAGGFENLLPSGITAIINELVAEQELNQPDDMDNEPDTPPTDASTTDTVLPTTTPEVVERPTMTENEPTKPAKSKFWSVALGALGVVVVLALIRFVFDHYVR